jgi:hypothetical protein
MSFHFPTVSSQNLPAGGRPFGFLYGGPSSAGNFRLDELIRAQQYGTSSNATWKERNGCKILVTKPFNYNGNKTLAYVYFTSFDKCYIPEYRLFHFHNHSYSKVWKRNTQRKDISLKHNNIF